MSGGAPRVSVVIPLYNAEGYLQEALESLLGQGAGELEVVIVDDCSTDDSLWVARRYAAVHPELRVQVLQQPNRGGASRARNRGLQHATGDFVSFVDADDCLPPGALRSLLRVADAHAADLVVGASATFVTSGGERTFQSYAGLERAGVFAFEAAGALAELPRVVSAPAAWGKLVRRDLVEAHHLRFPVDLVIGEDHVFSIAAYASARRIAVTPRVVYHYRRSVSSSATADLYRLAHFRCIHALTCANLVRLRGWPRYYYSLRLLDYEILHNVRRLGRLPWSEARCAFDLLRAALSDLDQDACEDFLAEQPSMASTYRELKSGSFARCWAKNLRFRLVV